MERVTENLSKTTCQPSEKVNSPNIELLNLTSQTEFEGHTPDTKDMKIRTIRSQTSEEKNF